MRPEVRAGSPVHFLTGHIAQQLGRCSGSSRHADDAHVAVQSICVQSNRA